METLCHFSNTPYDLICLIHPVSSELMGTHFIDKLTDIEYIIIIIQKYLFLAPSNYMS